MIRKDRRAQSQHASLVCLYQGHLKTVATRTKFFNYVIQFDSIALKYIEFQLKLS